MISGIGVDTVQLDRIANALNSSRFKERVFTQKEQDLADQKVDQISFYAGRWAAKEAVAKALGCGFGAKCTILDIEILNDELGKPEVTLSGVALAEFIEKNAKTIQLSISHDKLTAIAFVVIEN